MEPTTHQLLMGKLNVLQARLRYERITYEEQIKIHPQYIYEYLNILATVIVDIQTVVELLKKTPEYTHYT